MNNLISSLRLQLPSKLTKLALIRLCSSSSSSDLTLIKSLSEVQRKALIGTATANKFRMLTLEDELRYLDNRKFPLPEALNERQWERLFSLKERISRTLYLDSIGQKQEDEQLYEVRFYIKGTPLNRAALGTYQMWLSA